MSDAVLVPLVLGLAVAVVLLLAGLVVVGLRVRRLGTDQRRAFEGVEVDVLAALARHTRRLDGADAALDELRSFAEATRTDLGRALTRLGLVRYDAFGDMGGRMSFSAALIDDHGNGFVLTSVHARSESRSYIKQLRGGMSEVNLSPEESAAVADAVASIPQGRLD